MDGIESARRARPAEETLGVWREMVAGSPEGRRHCMRFKIDMQDPNKAMRDPVAYRCNDSHHWRTGTKYKASAVSPPTSYAVRWNAPNLLQVSQNRRCFALNRLDIIQVSQG